LKNNLAELPDTASDQLKNGLLQAHGKLIDYHSKTDESPFYLWDVGKAILNPAGITPAFITYIIKF
jgi:hypothetical protein